jgi:hypothetical protein
MATAASGSNNAVMPVTSPAFSLATNNRSKSWGSLAGSLVVRSSIVTLRQLLWVARPSLKSIVVTRGVKTAALGLIPVLNRSFGDFLLKTRFVVRWRWLYHLDMIRATTGEVLETFSEKVSRLEKSTLWRLISSEGWKASWDFEANRPGDDARMPEIEQLEAYVLNLRFFIQDNEPTSLRNMDSRYKRECQDSELRRQFSEVRDAMNGALDRELWFRFNDQPMTYRMLLNGMIYTRLAHASKDKHLLFDQMATHPFGRMMAMNEFLKCIAVVHGGVILINKLNARALPQTVRGTSDLS